MRALCACYHIQLYSGFRVCCPKAVARAQSLLTHPCAKPYPQPRLNHLPRRADGYTITSLLQKLATLYASSVAAGGQAAAPVKHVSLKAPVAEPAAALAIAGAAYHNALEDGAKLQVGTPDWSLWVTAGRRRVAMSHWGMLAAVAPLGNALRCWWAAVLFVEL